MPQPATLQDVADKAGVHRSTVSLALRNNARISAEVRERVQRIARELDYRTNPLVTALMRSRRTHQAAKHVVLAYVTNHPTRYGWRPPHHDRPDYFPCAAARAAEDSAVSGASVAAASSSCPTSSAPKTARAPAWRMPNTAPRAWSASTRVSSSSKLMSACFRVGLQKAGKQSPKPLAGVLVVTTKLDDLVREGVQICH